MKAPTFLQDRYLIDASLFFSRQLDSYYKRKPLAIARRFVEVLSSLAHFLFSVLSDVLTNNWDKNMQVRAIQMREFTSSNGPAFIKVSTFDVLYS